jgi:hypothetical protein
MAAVQPQFLTMVLNGLLVALVITFPFLLGLVLLSILRRTLNGDRHVFEQDVLGKLEQIQQDLAALHGLIKP